MRSFVLKISALAVALAPFAIACGGTTPFSGGQPFAIAGTPPPPPPPPPTPPPEPPKPPPRVVMKDNKIDFAEKIQFEANKAVIKPESFGLLKEIADVIKQNPQVKKISIEGHASAEGDAKANMKLSDERAKSVMKYLVDKESIPAAELTAKGWGITKPIADNTTEEGREKNRRVEFLVVSQDVTQKKVEIDPTTGKENVVSETHETLTAPGADTSTPTPPPPSSAKKPSSPPPAMTAKKPGGSK